MGNFFHSWKFEILLWNINFYTLQNYRSSWNQNQDLQSKSNEILWLPNVFSFLITASNSLETYFSHPVLKWEKKTPNTFILFPLLLLGSCESSFSSKCKSNVAAYSDNHSYVYQDNALQLTPEENSFLLGNLAWSLQMINYKISRSVIHYDLLFNQLIWWFQWMTLFVASCIPLTCKPSQTTKKGYVNCN